MMRRTAKETWAILGVPCDECGAKRGQPCLASRRSHYRAKGQPIKGFHVKRVFAAGIGGKP